MEAPRRVDRDLVRVMVRVSAHEENNTSVEWPRRLQRASGCVFLCLSACLPTYLPMRMKMALLYLLGYSRYAYLGVRTNMALLALLRLLRVQSAELWLYPPYYGCTTAVLRLYYGCTTAALAAHLGVRVPAEDEDGAVGRGRSEAEARVRQRAHLVS